MGVYGNCRSSSGEAKYERIGVGGWDEGSLGWGGVGTGQILHLSMHVPTYPSMKVFLQGPVEKGSGEPAPG